MRYLLNGFNWDPSFSDSIPNLLLAHIVLTLTTMALALLLAFPLSLLLLRYSRLYLPTIAIADVLYTVPSLAAFALLVPFTGLSQTTVLIPLVAFAQIVLIRNIVAGLRSVDPALQEVGRAMGMSERQVLWRITLPLALPVIVAGIRVATVTTIGIATIAPLVGVNDLGRLIFQGFNYAYPDQILAGAIVVSLLAIAADLGLQAVERALSHGRANVASGL